MIRVPMLSVIATCLFIVVMITVVSLRQLQLPTDADSHTPTPAAILPRAEMQELTAAADNSEEQSLAASVAMLKAQIGASITDVRVQASLRVLRNEWLSADPDNGLQQFRSLIQQAFPQQADAIFQLIAALDDYDRWLQSQLLWLNGQSVEVRESALWQERYARFGADADRLWIRVQSDVEHRDVAMNEALALAGQPDVNSFDERLQTLTTAYQALYLGKVEDLIYDMPGVLSTAFLSLEEVQADLAAMSAEDRQWAIDNTRRELGFPESRIAALAQQDQAREQDWQVGYKYMEERSRLSTRYQGAELDQALTDLRNATFGERASTIAREESMGFFRYQRPRVYGRN